MKKWSRKWRWFTVISISIIVICVLGLVWGYRYLEPTRHFSNQDIPVLVTPQVVGENNVVSDSTPQPIDSTNAFPSKSGDDKMTKEFNVLILGIDGSEDEISRTDVIMVARVVPAMRKIDLISIPRDTRMQVEGVGYTKVNHAHAIGELSGGNKGGTSLTLQTISNFLNIPIHYYIKTNFAGFQDFIDTIGGVDITLERDLDLSVSAQTYIEKGTRHFDGKLALDLVRERYMQPNGDFSRQEEQSKVLKSVVIGLLQPEHIPRIVTLLPKVRKDIVDSNFTDADLISLAWLFKGIDSDNFQYTQIPGHSQYAMDPLVKSNLYYWIPDKEAISKIVQEQLGQVLHE
ncbi:LCP family protein [Paenibacillus sp. KN14-4R]|uniref:LCP family protein n=1 Tax=Paenibacillus sp. KN14-4R TaxID=3445773 RepID=UPI003F9FD754